MSRPLSLPAARDVLAVVLLGAAAATATVQHHEPRLAHHPWWLVEGVVDPPPIERLTAALELKDRAWRVRSARRTLRQTREFGTGRTWVTDDRFQPAGEIERSPIGPTAAVSPVRAPGRLLPPHTALRRYAPGLHDPPFGADGSAAAPAFQVWFEREVVGSDLALAGHDAAIDIETVRARIAHELEVRCSPPKLLSLRRTLPILPAAIVLGVPTDGVASALDETGVPDTTAFRHVHVLARMGVAQTVPSDEEVATGCRQLVTRLCRQAPAWIANTTGHRLRARRQIRRHGSELLEFEAPSVPVLVRCHASRQALLVVAAFLALCLLAQVTVVRRRGVDACDGGVRCVAGLCLVAACLFLPAIGGAPVEPLLLLAAAAATRFARDSRVRLAGRAFVLAAVWLAFARWSFAGAADALGRLTAFVGVVLLIATARAEPTREAPPKRAGVRRPTEALAMLSIGIAALAPLVIRVRESLEWRQAAWHDFETTLPVARRVVERFATPRAWVAVAAVSALILVVGRSERSARPMPWWMPRSVLLAVAAAVTLVAHVSSIVIACTGGDTVELGSIDSVGKTAALAVGAMLVLAIGAETLRILRTPRTDATSAT